MPPTFHDYPIPSDRHPEHVNWTANDDLLARWVREDGNHDPSSPDIFAYVDGDMARLDRESPMPRPPVLVGQVWRTTKGEGEYYIQITQSETPTHLPPGSDLVWGPFAPWQDTRQMVVPAFTMIEDGAPLYDACKWKNSATGEERWIPNRVISRNLPPNCPTEEQFNAKYELPEGYGIVDYIDPELVKGGP